MRRINNKITKVQDIMDSYKVPCWLMYCDESSDPYFAQILTSKTIVPAIAVVGSKKCTLISHRLDSDNMNTYNNIRNASYDKEPELWKEIEHALELLGYPNTIALTYSTMRDAQVDVIGYGLYTSLTKQIKQIYSSRNLKVRFCSAEKLIYAYSDRKDKGDIIKMRIAARRALELLERAFRQVVPGMSELDVRNLVHSLMKQKPTYFKKYDVVSEEYAWDKDICPVVLAGPSLAKGGHATASRLRIKRGHTIYFDFGVRLVFKDGSSWSSDIQRMGYILKRTENQAPPDVIKMFDTLVEAIDIGMKTIRPGMKGYEIDAVVRKHIRDRGYPDYNHSTGHAIGELAHNPGALLGTKERKLSHLRVQPNGVYSMEPRIAIRNGGSIEEMVLVTPDGGAPLCSPQKLLYLVH